MSGIITQNPFNTTGYRNPFTNLPVQIPYPTQNASPIERYPALPQVVPIQSSIPVIPIIPAPISKVIPPRTPTRDDSSLIINPPYQFSTPNPYQYEGTFDDKYYPVISEYLWEDKIKFLTALKNIELYIKTYSPTSTSRSPRVGINGTGYIIQDILYRSYYDPRIILGTHTYYDNDMQWWEGYGDYYINQYNVMPTERFYTYVINRIKRL